MIKKSIFIALLASLFLSCDKVDDDRIPPLAVYLNFGNTGMWNTYGVSGYGQSKYFNKSEGTPANYSYKATDYTGFGGILLVYGINGPVAYDAACPVEAKKDVRVTVDPDNYEAVCATCGSRYNVCDADGAPLSGSAVERKYGLSRISVTPSGGGYIISR